MKDRKHGLSIGAAIALCAALAGLAIVHFRPDRQSSSPPAVHPEVPAVYAGREAGVSVSADKARPILRPANQGHEGSLAADFAALKTADGEHLLAYYQRGIEPSAKMEERFLAMEVIQACNGYANPRILTREAVTSMSSVSEEHPSRPIVEQRREILANRCAPLNSIGTAAWRAATLRLGAELNAPDSSFRTIRLTSENGEPIKGEELEQARQQMRSQLDRYGPLALDWTAGSLLELAGIDKDRPGRMDFGDEKGAWTVTGVALAITPCLASQPCDSNSLYALGMCIGSGGTDCEDSVDAALLAHLPDADSKARARKMANEIVGAIAARDWERLGL